MNAAAIDVLTREYNAECREIAEECAKEIAAGHLVDSDAAHEWLDESVDGHEFIIYTQSAQLVVALSSNDSAYEDDFGDKPATVGAQAFAAMRRDVQQYFDALDVEFSKE